MKLVAIICVFLLSCSLLRAQSGEAVADTAVSNDTFRRLDLLGFVPSKADQINGLAVGWLMLGPNLFDHDQYEINGLYVNPSPIPLVISVFAAPYVVFFPFMALKGRKKRQPLDSLTWEIEPAKSTINGLAVDAVELSEDFRVNGVQVSALAHVMHSHHGLSVAGLFSASERAHGVQLAGLVNSVSSAKGVQIGLINHAVEMKGIQIGLWNQIGRRGFPLVNFRFKNNTNNTE